MSSAVIRGCFYYPSYYYKMNTSVKKNTSVKYVKPLLGYHLCWTHVKISLFSPFHFHVQLRKMVWNKNGMFTVFAFPSDSVFVFLASTKMRFAFSEELFHTPLIHSLVPLWNILDEKNHKEWLIHSSTDWPYVMMMLKNLSYSIHIVYKPCQSACLCELNLSGFWND